MAVSNAKLKLGSVFRQCIPSQKLNSGSNGVRDVFCFCFMNLSKSYHSPGQGDPSGIR